MWGVSCSSLGHCDFRMRRLQQWEPRCLKFTRCGIRGVRRTGCVRQQHRLSICKCENADDVREGLDRLFKETNTTSLTGEELRRLVYERWGRSYDVRIVTRMGRTYIHVMWGFLEQKSFPLTEDEYQSQLDAVAELCALWGVSELVRQGIKNAKRHPGAPVGGGPRPVQINLPPGLSMLGD